jgi:phosphoribosyl 1,2-cyclic phosphodiesterase
MFTVTILGSGSAGNCTLVETSKSRVLVDGGLSCKQTVQRLAQCGVNPLEIDGILLTHEHSDHASCLRVWCKQFQTPIYCNRLTAERLQREQEEETGCRKDWRIFPTGQQFSIGDIGVETFSVPHDAADPVGMILHHGDATLGFLMDLGFATKLAHERVRQVHTLVIEANHDEKLLQEDTRRPWSVKQRIMSRHGHLSNAAAASVIEQLLPGKIERVVLGHLSRDCNTPELAKGAVQALLAKCGREALEVYCADQREISARFRIGETRPGPFQPTFDDLFFPSARIEERAA